MATKTAAGIKADTIYTDLELRTERFDAQVRAADAQLDRLENRLGRQLPHASTLAGTAIRGAFTGAVRDATLAERAIESVADAMESQATTAKGAQGAVQQAVTEVTEAIASQAAAAKATQGAVAKMGEETVDAAEGATAATSGLASVIAGPLGTAIGLAAGALVSYFLQAREEISKTEQRIIDLLDAAKRRKDSPVEILQLELAQLKEQGRAANAELVELVEKADRLRRQVFRPDQAEDVTAGDVTASVQALTIEQKLLDAAKKVNDAQFARIGVERDLAAARARAFKGHEDQLVREAQQLGAVLRSGTATEAQLKRITDLRRTYTEVALKSAGTDLQSLEAQTRALTILEALEDRRTKRKGSDAEARSDAALAAAKEQVRIRFDELIESAQAGAISLTEYDRGVRRVEQAAADLVARMKLAKENTGDFEEELTSATTAAITARNTLVSIKGDAVAFEFRKIMAELTPGLVDDFRISLELLEADLRSKKFAEDKIEQIIALKKALHEAGQAAESTRSFIAALVTDTTLTPIQKLNELTKIRQDLEADEIALAGKRGPDVDAKRLEIGRLRLLVEEAMAKVGRSASQTDDERLRKQQEAQRHAIELARKIEDGASAALQLAEAFGIVDEKTAAALQNVVQLAAAIPGILAGEPTSIASGSAAIVSLLASAFGQNPAAEQRAREHRENLDALKAIEKHTGDLLGVATSGRDIGAITSGVQGLLALTGDAGGFRRFGDKGPLRGINEKNVLEASTGLAFAEIEALAKSLGVTLNGTKQSYLDFLEALKSADLASFGKGFEGQIRKLEIESQLDPDAFEGIEGLIKRIKVLTGPDGAPAIAKALEGIDLSTAEGRQSAIERLADVLRNVENLDVEELGGLSLDAFIEEILAIIAGLRDETEQAAADAAALRSKQRSDLERDLAFDDVTDPFAVLDARAETFAQQFGDKFPELFKDFTAGLDLTTKEGLDTFSQRLSDARDWLIANAEALGLTEAELEEMLAGLYDLESGADAAEAAIKSLADTLNEEFSNIELQGAIFGRSDQEITGAKLAALGITGDLASQAGRDAIVEALRERARTTQDTEVLRLLAALIGEVQQLGGDVASGATGAGGGGERSAITSAAQALTERTGNRMADYLATLVLLGRQELELLKGSLLGNLTATLARLPAITAPALPASFGAPLVSAGGQGAVALQTSGPLIGVVNVNLPEGSITPGTLSMSSLGRGEFRRLVDEIEQELARRIVQHRRLRGDASQ